MKRFLIFVLVVLLSAAGMGAYDTLGNLKGGDVQYSDLEYNAIAPAPYCTATRTNAVELLDDTSNTNYSGVAFGTVSDDNTYFLQGVNAVKFTGNGLVPGAVQTASMYRSYGAGSYVNITSYDHLAVRFYVPALTTAGESNTEDLYVLYLRLYDANNYYRTYTLWTNRVSVHTGWNYWCATKLGYDSQSNAAFDETQIKDFYFLIGQSAAIAFHNGSTEPQIYHRIVGKASGAYLILTGVKLLSGSWSEGTAAGYLYGGLTGTFTENELLNIYDSATATTVTTDAANTRYKQLSFTSGGTYTVAVGNTITGATSGATAVVAEVLHRGGTWAGGDATGQLFLTDVSGTFQAENINVGANSNVATIGSGNALVAKVLAGSKNEFTVDSLYMRSGFDVPGVVLRFDDCGVDTLTIGSYLAEKGLRACFVAIPGIVGTSNYLTYAQIAELKRMGHDIVSHGYDHTLMDRVTANQAIQALGKARDVLVDNGFVGSSMIYCQPQGRWSTIAENAIADYCPLILTSYNDSSNTPSLSPMLWPQRLTGVVVADETGAIATSARLGVYTVTGALTVDSACKDAIQTRSWICLYWHNPGAGAEFTQFQADITALKVYIDGGSLKNYSVMDIVNGTYDQSKPDAVYLAADGAVRPTDNNKIHYLSGVTTATLPEASTVLGKTYYFVKSTADATNLDVADGTDIFLYAGCAAGDKLLNSTIGSTIRVTAVSANNWIVGGVNVAWTDNN